jgi:hypothetical protein
MLISGNYKNMVSTPVGQQEGSLTLVADGNALSGTLVNEKGSTDFAGGTIAGNEVHYLSRPKLAAQ